MKTFLLIASLTTVCAAAFAAIPYEPFSDATGAGGTSYEVGQNLAGQANASYASFTNLSSWYLRTGPGSSGEPTIVSAGLSYSGLSTSGGNAAAFGPNGNSTLMNLSTKAAGITTGTVYFSYLLRLTDLTGLSEIGARITGVDQLQSQNTPSPGIPSLGATVMVRSDAGTGFNIGLDGGGKGGTHATIAWDATSYHSGDTLFLVGSYNFGASATEGFGELWINPSSNDLGEASAPTANLTSSGNNASLARVASIILLQDVDGPTGQMDDLRIDTTWAGVTPTPVPEPSSLVLGILGLSSWLFSRKFWRAA